MLGDVKMDPRLDAIDDQFYLVNGGGYSVPEIGEMLVHCRNLVVIADGLAEALGALADPDGHIWHGGGAVCTGECLDVQAALIQHRNLR